MHLELRKIESVSILELSGRFDAYEVGPVVEWINQNMEAFTTRLVINLSGVKFVDSTALATLVQGMKRCRQQQGDLHLCCLQQPVRIIFELTRLDRAIDIFATEREAVETFGD
ncbi:MAG: STAS domain-containing protein [Chloroflexi bacterium]|nr:STAS domain-containing protein [Chloroflexota bacterium]